MSHGHILHRTWTWKNSIKLSFRQQCMWYVFILFNFLLVVDGTMTWPGQVRYQLYTCQSSLLMYKSKITLPKASKLHRCTFKISKIFLGRGSPSPLPKPLPPISLGASRLDPALRADSALRASVRASRKLGALRLHANVVRTYNICTAREKILPTPLKTSEGTGCRSQTSSWCKPSGDCHAAHTRAALASCAESNSVQTVYADVRCFTRCGAGISCESVPSLRRCEAAFNVTWSIRRPVFSTVVRAEVLSHHWTKGLELLAGPCSHSSISNNFCQQTENTSLHTRIFTLVSIFCTVVFGFH